MYILRRIVNIIAKNFFFFLKNEARRAYYWIAKRFVTKVSWILERTNHIHSKIRKESLALLAKTWVKVLSCLIVRQKENFCNELAKDTIYLMMWPKDGWSKFLLQRVLIEVLESPSKIELCRSNFYIKLWAQTPAMSGFLVKSTPRPRVDWAEGEKWSCHLV